MDCRPPASSASNSPGKNTRVGSHALLQKIFLNHVFCTAGRFFTIWTTREALHTNQGGEHSPFSARSPAQVIHFTFKFKQGLPSSPRPRPPPRYTTVWDKPSLLSSPLRLCSRHSVTFWFQRRAWVAAWPALVLTTSCHLAILAHGFLSFPRMT